MIADDRAVASDDAREALPGLVGAQMAVEDHRHAAHEVPAASR